MWSDNRATRDERHDSFCYCDKTRPRTSVGFDPGVDDVTAGDVCAKRRLALTAPSVNRRARPQTKHSDYLGVACHALNGVLTIAWYHTAQYRRDSAVTNNVT